MFSTFQIDEMYREPHGTEVKIKGMAIDIYRNILILMQKVPQRKDIKFIALDMGSNKTIGICWVADTTIVGRIRSQMFLFCSGHMYFGNEVYKFRYDNMIKT
jgi:hypothetical protein